MTSKGCQPWQQVSWANEPSCQPLRLLIGWIWQFFVINLCEGMMGVVAYRENNNSRWRFCILKLFSFQVRGVCSGYQVFYLHGCLNLLYSEQVQVGWAVHPTTWRCHQGFNHNHLDTVHKWPFCCFIITGNSWSKRPNSLWLYPIQFSLIYLNWRNIF